jgi:hypothetical protein
MPAPNAVEPSRAPVVRAVAVLVLAAAVWLPCLHLLYHPAPGEVARRAERLAAAQLELFRDGSLHDREAARMRGTNPEWDFMGRTFLAYALAEMAARDPGARARHLEALDAVVADTLRLERLYYLLMPYAKTAPFRVHPARSLFIDGEIALALALRRSVEERPDYAPMLRARVAAMVAQMQEGPVLSGESYPDECWTSCNTVALAALKASDVLDGTDHGASFRAWVDHARRQLVDAGTGMLISSYTLDGAVRDGPEAPASGWPHTCCAPSTARSRRTNTSTPRRSWRARSSGSDTRASGRRRGEAEPTWTRAPSSRSST